MFLEKNLHPVFFGRKVGVVHIDQKWTCRPYTVDCIRIRDMGYFAEHCLHPVRSEHGHKSYSRSSQTLDVARHEHS